MMVHLEGPVVDSIYDNMLISWDESLSPTFPCLTEPSPTSHPSLFPYLFTDSNPYLANIDVAKAARAARILLSQQADEAKKGEQTASLAPPEWWRRESATAHSPHPRPFAALGLGLGTHASSNPHGEADGAATGEVHGGEGKFAALVAQLVEKAREEKARLALGMSSMMGEGHRGHPHGAEGQASAALRAVTGENGESLADSGFDGGSKRSEDRTVVNGESSGATSNGVRAATASGSEDAGPGSQAALAVQTNGTSAEASSARLVR